MGLFMDLAAVLAPPAAVRDYLSKVEGLGEKFACTETSQDRTLVFFAEVEAKSDRVKRLSEALDIPAFWLHVHDEDLWMYEFFFGGNLIDKFNPKPNYWQKLPEGEAAGWKGNARIIAEHWKGLAAVDIERYLMNQEGKDFDSKALAYPTDTSPYWDIWQITDFLAKLGTPYPKEEHK